MSSTSSQTLNEEVACSLLDPEHRVTGIMHCMPKGPTGFALKPLVCKRA